MKRNFLGVFYSFFFLSEREIGDYPSTLFCTRCFLIIFWRAFLREALFKFLPKKLQGKTLCKLFQIFPYILHRFLLIPFHKLIEKYLINWLVVEENLKQIKYIEYKTCCLLRIYWKIIKMRWDKLVTSLYWLKYQYTRRQRVNIQFISNVLKKKLAHAYFGRPYFF